VTAHPGGEKRNRDRLDVSHGRDQREEADQEAEDTHVRGNPDACPTAAKGAMNDGGRGQSSEEAPETAGCHLSRAADRRSDSDAKSRSDECADSDPEQARSEDPDENDSEAHSEAEAQADRVPTAHGGQCREAGASGRITEGFS